MNDQNKIIEINGIKMEIDARSATLRKVESYRIGDPVKLLLKNYSSFDVKFGVIVGFDEFASRPTITIAYIESSSEIKYCYIYNGAEHEIVPVGSHDLALEKTWIIDRMKDRIIRKEHELSEEKAKMESFITHFGKYFEKGLPDAGAVS